MSEELQSLSPVALKAIWQDAGQEPFLREEALWEYWRRVAKNGLPVSLDELQEIFALDNGRTADVLGLLARADLLPDESFRAAQRFQAEHENAWLAGQLRARALLRRIKQGDMPGEDELCDGLVAKGTSWAALEAIPLLPADRAQSLLRSSEDRAVFSKGQRHELRLRVSKMVAK